MSEQAIYRFFRIYFLIDIAVGRAPPMNFVITTGSVDSGLGIDGEEAIIIHLG